MPDVLRMATSKLSDPVAFPIQVVANDRLLHDFGVTLMPKYA
jgi:hypothetical protein